MNILLDTHIFLWWVLDDERLPERWRDTLEASENTVFLSAVTAWEIVIKQGIGRLKVADDPVNWFRKSTLPITSLRRCPLHMNTRWPFSTCRLSTMIPSIAF